MLWQLLVFEKQVDRLRKRLTTIYSEDLRSFSYISRYGVGYRLTLVKAADCKVVETSSLVYNHVQNAKLVSDVGAELAFILPSQSSSGFERLFTELESKLLHVMW